MPGTFGQRRLRILQVITRLVRGGAQNVVLSIADGLVKRGHDCIIATGLETGREGQLFSKAESLGLRVVSVPRMVRDAHLLEDLAAVAALYKVMRAGRFDVIHTHTSKAGLLGRITAWLARVPAIVHSPHGHIFAPAGNIPGVTGRPMMKVFFYWLERAATRLCDHMVCLSANEMRELLRMRIARRGHVSVIPNAVDFAALREFVPAKMATGVTLRSLGAEEGDFLVGVAGRLAAEKGMPILLEAMKRIVSIAPTTRLIVAGDGPERPSLEDLSRKLGLENRVNFLGMREDLPRVMAALHVFVLPSLYEGFGLVLLEAMAVGKPVVATQVGGIPEIVEDGVTGLLVPPSDPAALSEAILRLRRDPALANTLAANACSRLRKDFDLPKMIDAVESLYFHLGKERTKTI